MKRRSKELNQAKKEGRRPHGGFGGGYNGSGSGYSSKSYSSADSLQSYDPTPKPSYTAPSKSVGATALKLGKKNKDTDSFVKKIESEGQRELLLLLYIICRVMLEGKFFLAGKFGGNDFFLVINLTGCKSTIIPSNPQ